MSSSFPLLRLPRLVLCEVFKVLGIGEKIKLSLCSKRISTQINNDRLYSQKVIVYLDGYNERIRVNFENNKDTFEIFVSPETEKTLGSNDRQYSIAGCTVIATKTGKGIRTLWKNYQDRQEGFRNVIQHLSNMFQCKISARSSCCDSDLFETRVSVLLDLQVKFERLWVRFTGSKDENLLFNQLSSGFGLVDDLTISCIPDTAFIPVFTSWPQEITIKNSAWFTLEHLLECASSTITLVHSHMGNKDIDQILRKWTAGELPYLERLMVTSLDFTNNEEHILGINLSELDGMAIQTDDGSKKAKLRLQSYRHCNVCNSIEMYIT